MLDKEKDLVGSLNDVTFLDGLVNTKVNIARMAIKNPRLGFDDDFNMFVKKMYLLTPSSYGHRIEAYIIEKAGLDRAPAAEDRGDSKNKLGAYFEGKAAFKDARGNYSFIQLRPWQKLDGYYFITVDPEKNFEEMYFYLTNLEARWEIYHIGRVIQGSKKVADDNKHNPRKISLKEHTLDYNRWLEKYRIPDFETLKKILNKKPFLDDKRVYYGRKYHKMLTLKTKDRVKNAEG